MFFMKRLGMRIQLMKMADGTIYEVSFPFFKRQFYGIKHFNYKQTLYKKQV